MDIEMPTHVTFLLSPILLDFIPNFISNFCNCPLFILGYMYCRSLFVSVFRSQRMLAWLKGFDVVLPIGFPVVFLSFSITVLFSTDAWLYDSIKMIVAVFYMAICTTLLHVSLFALRRNLVQIKDGRIEAETKVLLDSQIQAIQNTKDSAINTEHRLLSNECTSITKHLPSSSSTDGAHTTRPPTTDSNHSAMMIPTTFVKSGDSMNNLHKRNTSSKKPLNKLWTSLLRAAIISTMCALLMFYVIVRILFVFC